MVRFANNTMEKYISATHNRTSIVKTTDIRQQTNQKHRKILTHTEPDPPNSPKHLYTIHPIETMNHCHYHQSASVS